ncbi:hypothetical protein [Lentibacillus sp. Marseille-P4043]|uniref:hypothetical protein n=1 Tax=Lentibacillus sp. Marseille-P4043 TaxID=2040293 RepID=UPI000D0B4A8C|nr:hypothetical protein [Lentibacillus sp. Marseille-P4043]
MSKKKKRSQDLVPILIAIAIVLGFSSFFAPFVFITIAQDFFYQQVTGIWLFQSPISSYIIGGVAFLYLGLVVGGLAYYQSRVRGKKRLKTVGTLLGFIPGLIFIYLSVNQYYYFTNEGIYQNDLFSIDEKFYDWDEIEQAAAVSEKKDKQVSLSRLELTIKSGDILSYRYSRELVKSQYNVRDVLEDRGVELKQKLEGEEEE